jgi:hypothetical protein
MTDIKSEDRKWNIEPPAGYSLKISLSEGGFLDVEPPRQSATEYTASGEVTIPASSQTIIVKGVEDPIALTCAAPTRNGIRLTFLATTALAHTVQNTGGGWNRNPTTATFGGAIGDSFTVESYGGYWYIINSINITLS